MIAGGLGVMALLANAGAAAASDPIGTVVDDAAAPERSEPSVSAEVPEPKEPSVSAQVSEPSDASLSAEVAPSPEVSVSPEPTAPEHGGGTVEPIPPPEQLVSAVTERVADQPPTGEIPDAHVVVALDPLEPPSLPSTDATTPKLLDAIQDDRDVISSVVQATSRTLGEAPAEAMRPTAVERSQSAAPSLASDGRGVVAGAGDPVQRDSGPATPMKSTGNIGLSGADDGWNRGGVQAPGVVPAVAPVSGGSSGNSVTDLYPVAAVLATLAAGGAGGWILALRGPPNPSGIRLAAPVPPG